MKRKYYTFYIKDKKGKIYPRTTNGEIVTKWTDQIQNCGYWDKQIWFENLIKLYKPFNPKIIEIQVKEGRIITKG